MMCTLLAGMAHFLSKKTGSSTGDAETAVVGAGAVGWCKYCFIQPLAHGEPVGYT